MVALHLGEIALPFSLLRILLVEFIFHGINDIHDGIGNVCYFYGGIHCVAPFLICGSVII